MAPVAKYARTKSIPTKADSPLNVTTPMPVLRNAEPNSVFGFRPNPQRRSSNATKTRKLNVVANPDNIAPDSEAEESVELEDHETEDPRPVDPEARHTIDEQSPSEDESRAREFLKAPNVEDDENSYSILGRHHKKNGIIRPPNPTLLNSKQEEHFWHNIHINLREHVGGKARCRESEPEHVQPRDLQPEFTQPRSENLYPQHMPLIYKPGSAYYDSDENNEANENECVASNDESQDHLM
ncbi:hypothetical protein BDZ94DRAFT_1298997 [Collybia nuda]|uniref:Uncharacterized protein n=1 Tax=Collybia nuda TaxID=64659 RepID=A0A9P6CDF9_9AGAR|nr:hypothetical protein BDZ94DRAFT_1298997 [Collybia nuda]